MTFSIMSRSMVVMGDFRGVLGGKHHGVHAARGDVVLVFDGHLSLAVGAQIGPASPCLRTSASLRQTLWAR